MIDSHCHLADRKLTKDIVQILENAKKAGVTMMVTIADTISEANDCRIIAEKYENVFFTAGVHPHHAKDFLFEQTAQAIRDFTLHPKCKGIGEIGLDYHYMNSPKDAQLKAFEMQLKLAVELNLSVVVHTREAIKDTWTIMNSVKPKKAVLHCCTEKWEDVGHFVDAGWLLSFTGIATYPASTDIRDTIKHCPLDQLMIETDAPYLAPESKRGQRNEPAFVAEVLKCVAEVKNISIEEADRATTKNTIEFYGLE